MIELGKSKSGESSDVRMEVSERLVWPAFQLFSSSLYLSEWLVSPKRSFNTFIIFDREPVVSAL